MCDRAATNHCRTRHLRIERAATGIQTMTRLISVAVASLVFPALLMAGDDDVSVLIRDLRAIKAERRVHAAQALGRLGAAAAPATRALVSALADPSFAVQAEVLTTL